MSALLHPLFCTSVAIYKISLYGQKKKKNMCGYCYMLEKKIGLVGQIFVFIYLFIFIFFYFIFFLAIRFVVCAVLFLGHLSHSGDLL
jgi:hypothetical protein